MQYDLEFIPHSLNLMLTPIHIWIVFEVEEEGWDGDRILTLSINRSHSQGPRPGLNYISHIEHLRWWICFVSNCRTSQTLRIHSRMVHQGMMGKIFSCNDCDYSTANKQTLRQHIDRIHMGIQVIKVPLVHIFINTLIRNTISP